MSDFPSINDLKNTSPSNPSAPLPVSDSEHTESFTKKMGEINRKELEVQAERYAAQIGFPHIDLTKFPVSQEALRQISRENAEKFGVVCFFASSDEVRVGSLDPTNPKVEEILKDIETRKHAGGGLYVISEVSMEHVLQLYDRLPTIKPITKDVEITTSALKKVEASVNNFASVENLVKEASTTDILTILLGAALKVEASDVHIEAEEEGIVVRYRLDGILHDVTHILKDAYLKLLSRIKLLSQLKININAKPQDGRFTIKSPDGDVDVRVSTIPTVFGESVVLRLLIQGKEGITLENLGLRADTLKIIQEQIVRPNGMIITTGPTGSGKSTTLYAMLRILNEPGVKIITLEDPVEYRLQGINQSQIDHSKDYTFAKGLRSILRQDPDIVMVGEIRDAETAEIAVQAALTGHLMLSTLHTNSAAGAIPRFLSMGTQSYLLAPALNCVMGQRLVRRICTNCKVKVSFEKLPVDIQMRMTKARDQMNAIDKKELETGTQVFFEAKPEGCDVCNGIGYKGQVGLYEIFVVNDHLKEAILTGSVSDLDILRLAKEQGMRTMVEEGILKAKEGITTLDEVFRVIE